MIGELGDDGWVRVEWSNGTTNSYRMGIEGKYDLTLASPPSPVTSESETEELSDPSTQTIKHNQLIRLLRDACVNFLRNVTLSAGLSHDNLHSSTVHGLSSLLCCALNNDLYSEWCNLTLIRSITQSRQLSIAFSTKPWINLLLENLMKTKDLPKQIQSIRLLEIVLRSWDMDQSEIPAVLERLLLLLGQVVITCMYDKPINHAKSLVLLTQSHSSTVGQELIQLLRALHNLLGWNQVLNAILIQKLNLAAYFLSDMQLLNDGITSDQQHYMVIACMNVIGGWDSRPRIGSCVEIENNCGTIVRVTPKGKLCVQFNDNQYKKVGLNNLKILPMVEFNFDRMLLNENFLKTWANLLLLRHNSLNQRSFHGQINAVYLHTQQNILSALNATRILHTNQYKLRKILKQAVNGMDQSQEQQSIEEELNQQPVLLIQKLLAKATQPSPLKPGFNLQEMQLATLNLSQYLAAEGNFENVLVTNGISNEKPTPKNVTRCNSELATPNSECSIKSVVSEKTSKRRELEEDVPVHPMVTQIVEMGFTKKAVETAIKTLAIGPDTLMSPESIIGWLLEHHVMATEDTDSLSSVYESDTESVSYDNGLGAQALPMFVSIRAITIRFMVNDL